MRYSKIIILTYVLFFLRSEGQNLVPNPSFENFSVCPTFDGQLNRAIPWFNPTGNTPDYCNACYTGTSAVPVDVPANYFGYQLAKTGNGYADVAVFASGNGREYIEVKLIDSLRTDKSYCITFYVSNADSCKWATSRIGAYFSADSIHSPFLLVLNYVPQVANPFGNIITDAVNWTKISGVFTAAGGERFMTIGNFYDNANTDTVFVGNYLLPHAYFYIDDVSVYELPEDSANCFDGLGVEEIEKENEILIYPNPATDKLSINNYQLSGESLVTIYSLYGARIFQSTIQPINNSIINLSSYPNGIYFLSIKNKEKIFSEKFIISR